MKKIIILLILFIVCRNVFGQKTIQYSFHANDWISEVQIPDSTHILWQKDRLVIDSKAGVTIWWKKPLSGYYRIEYDRTFLSKNVAFSRLSDLNQFWAATAQDGIFPFQKEGSLASYNDLQLFYMGYGGNSNSTTRFRIYDGSGQRILQKEYLQSTFLLQKNTVYHIKTEVDGNHTTVWVNGIKLFDYEQKEPIRKGYFGFRQTWSAQLITHFKITTF